MLTHSGRLFIMRDSHALDRKKVYEWPLDTMGVGPVECMSEVLNKEHNKVIIGTKSGKIYEYHNNKTYFVDISDHELEDGSRITKVHEFCSLLMSDNVAEFVRVSTSKHDSVILSACLRVSPNSTEKRGEHLGRKVDEKRPLNKLHMIDVDPKMTQFKSMSANKYMITAIDQYGEIWYIGGIRHPFYTSSAGFDYQDEERHVRLPISRPICSNHMRKENKIALKVKMAYNYTTAIVKDIVTGKSSLKVLLGKQNESYG